MFPDELEAHLREIAEAAVRAGIDPVVESAERADRAELESIARQAFSAFVKQRSRIWPPLVQYISTHPLVVLRLLREVSQLVRAEWIRLKVPRLREDDPASQSVMRLRLALKTYQMTLDLTLASVPLLVSTLASRGPPKEIAEPSAMAQFLDGLDLATARLEFGFLLGVRLLEDRPLARNSTLEVAVDYGAKGADEQHVMVRGMLRRILGDKTMLGKVTPGSRQAADEVPPEALLADWVRAVLAA